MLQLKALGLLDSIEALISLMEFVVELVPWLLLSCLTQTCIHELVRAKLR